LILAENGGCGPPDRAAAAPPAGCNLPPKNDKIINGPLLTRQARKRQKTTPSLYQEKRKDLPFF
jgi:hypothetical protein